MTKTKNQGAALPREHFNPAAMKRLLTYIKKYKGRMAAVIVCILISSAVSVASSLFLGTLIDDYITPLLKDSQPVFSGLLRAVITMGVIYLVGVLSTWIYNRIMVTIAQNTLKDIRDEMFEKMQKFPVSYFDTHTNGDIMSRYTNDTDTLRQMIAQSLAQLIASVSSIIAVFISMLWQSVYLTVVVLVVMAAIMQVAGLIMRKSGTHFISQQQALGDLDGYIEEIVNGQKVVKVFCYEKSVRNKFFEKNQKWTNASSQANGYANAMMPIMNGLGYVQYVIVAIVGAWLVISGGSNLTLTGMGTLTLGAVASFLTLSRNFTNPISQLSNQFNSIVTALAGADRIFSLIDQKPETDDGYVTLEKQVTDDNQLLWVWKHPHSNGEVEYKPLEGNIILDKVDFGYTQEKNVLSDITINAKAGQKIAFVGATGAGKTTIANLINRFYDIADGKIRFDGINVNKIRKADLRRSVGVVLQDVNLFTGSVMENIRYGNPNASDEDCIAAAKLANAHNFIEMLPQGYNTIIRGDGGTLSQGQRQLISIARAAAANPPVMILDEATSSIDTRTEALVQNGMDRLMAGRTVFVIAHRLSTVRNSDLIAVLAKGRIIEQGTHEQLLSLKGMYYKLYTGAFELE